MSNNFGSRSSLAVSNAAKASGDANRDLFQEGVAQHAYQHIGCLDSRLYTNHAARPARQRHGLLWHNLRIRI